MNIQDIEKGKRYNFSGDIENGFFNGKPFISHEEVTRTVKYITDTHIVCECGRRFLKNENLKATEVTYKY